MTHNYIDRLHDSMARVEEVRKWQRRFKNLKKKTGKSIAKFCDENSLSASQINHQMKGRRGATWGTIRKVNEALDKEGV